MALYDDLISSYNGNNNCELFDNTKYYIISICDMSASTIIVFMIYILFMIYTYFKATYVFPNRRRYIVHQVPPSLRILTYNVQRLPYLFRSEIDICKWMEKYDIVCLQENFCSIFGNHRNPHQFDFACTSAPFYKLADSGLCIYSKIPMRVIDFVRFKNSQYLDTLADKGFLVVQIADFILINTHLQSTYTPKYAYYDVAAEQLNEIREYCKNFKKVIIVGDFNLDLTTMDMSGFQKTLSEKPTHWNRMKYFLNQSATYEKDSTFKPFYYDGGFYKNVKLTDIKTESDDMLTDHLGISFSVSSS